jgi:hypothetical protein
LSKSGIPRNKGLASRNQVFKGKIPLFWGRSDGIAGLRTGVINATLTAEIKVRPHSARRIGEQHEFKDTPIR